ncbi:MAG: PH domain-containing protein [Sphingobacteriales bacterium]|nr:PH domain-containing protein [Sphingobacteriales bacterium]
MYRVKDYTVEEPFELRIFHLANIVLVSSDKSLPSITLYAISEAETLRDHIRYHVERLRAAKGVREVDLK